MELPLPKRGAPDWEEQSKSHRHWSTSQGHIDPSNRVRCRPTSSFILGTVGYSHYHFRTRVSVDVFSQGVTRVTDRRVWWTFHLSVKKNFGMCFISRLSLSPIHPPCIAESDLDSWNLESCSSEEIQRKLATKKLKTNLYFVSTSETL
ncbi:hypothetical protein J6590_075448 [Homalodisca vitripennis]|nr:hypothetical protein J6590_075448 [Homalodisca vitripennis]